MATVLDVIRAAHSKIGVQLRADDLESEYASVGLDALNEMLHAWKLRSVDISHTDVSLTDTFPLADEYREGTAYLLAEKISPEYRMPESFDADDWFRTFQAANATIPKLTVPAAVLRPPSREDREGNLPSITTRA